MARGLPTNYPDTLKEKGECSKMWRVPYDQPADTMLQRSYWEFLQKDYMSIRRQTGTLEKISSDPGKEEVKEIPAEPYKWRLKEAWNTIRKYIYIYCVHYEKALDRMDLKKLINIMRRMGVDWRDRRLIGNLNMEQKIRVKIEASSRNQDQLEGVEVKGAHSHLNNVQLIYRRTNPRGTTGRWTWWRIGWGDDFQQEGREFDSLSSRHVVT